MNTIVGLDVCSDCVVAWVLSGNEDIRNEKAYFDRKKKEDERSRKHEDDPLTFFFTKNGINELLTLKPDCFVLEPTGMRYSALIAKVAQTHNIKLLWVDHKTAANTRKGYKLPDKNDIADAFALARYGQLYKDFPSKFLEFEAGKVAEIREIYMQLKSLKKMNTASINRLKQQLAYEFPESAGVDIKPKEDGRRALICFLAGREREMKKKTGTWNYWPKKYKDSVAHEYNIKISDFTTVLAQRIDDTDIQCKLLELDLKNLVFSPEFEKYNKVFDLFSFELIARAILLVQIVPFTRFEDIGAFKRRLGYGMTEYSSGGSTDWKKGDGSKLCKSELYLWASTTIATKTLVTLVDENKKPIIDQKTGKPVKEVKHTRRNYSPVSKLINEYYDNLTKKIYADPAAYQKELLRKSQNRMLNDIDQIIDEELGELAIKQSVIDLKKRIDSLKKSLIKESIDLQIDARKAEQKFGNLILSRTCAYSVRWLYRCLKREFDS